MTLQRTQKIQLYIERIAFGAFALALCAAASYGLLLREVMVNASTHASLSRSIADTSSTLSELEFEYIELKQAVTLDRAHELGFIEDHEPRFVSIAPAKGLSIER